MQFISIEEITTNNNYLRLNTDVDKLKRSIQAVGLINPITINDKKELIAGGRRYQALKELGYKQVPVNIISQEALLQELISIDENLVRQDLTKLEIEKNLGRGREIYEELFPSATKMEEEDVTKPIDPQELAERPADKKSFLEVTAEKTGLSKKSIKQAIDRDAKSSSKIKELRFHGEINASQVNELIKLKASEQDEIVDYIKDRPVKEVRKLVKAITAKGLESAVQEVIQNPQLTKEYRTLHSFTKRLNKTVAKLILEEMTCEHSEMEKILEDLQLLQGQITKLLKLNSYSSTHHFSQNNFKEQAPNQALM